MRRQKEEEEAKQKEERNPTKAGEADKVILQRIYAVEMTKTLARVNEIRSRHDKSASRKPLSEASQESDERTHAAETKNSAPKHEMKSEDPQLGQVTVQTVAQKEVKTPEMREGLDTLNNRVGIDTGSLSDNTGASELGSSTSNEIVSDNIVILNDEYGSEIHVEFLDLITYRKKEYVVLLPIDGEADQVVILQVESIGPDEESYIRVDNEYTLEAVFSLFKERNKHEFNFID